MKKKVDYRILSLIVMLIIVSFSSCKKDDDQNENIPELSTIEISNITYESAVAGGVIVNDGGSTIVKQGVCWSTEENPTIADNFTVDEGEGSFVSQLTGLDDESTYYVRSYATNEMETGYGNQILFETTKKPSNSFHATIDGMLFNPSQITKVVAFGTIQISATIGTSALIIRFPNDFTIGVHLLSLTGYSGQYFLSTSQLYTSTNGSGFINIIEHDEQSGRIKAAFNFIGTNISNSSTVTITNGEFEVIL
jgi:uncharacterized protein DUF6252